jgi:hypothetical protein
MTDRLIVRRGYCFLSFVASHNLSILCEVKNQDKNLRSNVFYHFDFLIILHILRNMTQKNTKSKENTSSFYIGKL